MRRPDRDPLFPVGMGVLLHGILNPPSAMSPPWVHTVVGSRPEDGRCHLPNPVSKQPARRVTSAPSVQRWQAACPACGSLFRFNRTRKQAKDALAGHRKRGCEADR